MAFVFQLVAARRLGVSGFGVFSFSLAFVTLLGVFADLGLGQLSVREIARDHGAAEWFLRVGVSLKLVVSLLIMVAAVALSGLLGYSRQAVAMVALCSPLILISAIASYYMSIFQGLEKMEYTAFSRLTQTALLIGGAALLTKTSLGPIAYAVVYVVAAAVSTVFLLVSARGFARGPLDFRVREWGHMLRPALPFGVATLFAIFYYWNGTALLSKIAGDRAVGIYSAPFRLVIGANFAVFALAGSLYPMMARAHMGSRARMLRLLSRATKYVLMLALPLGVFGSCLARPVIGLFYGSVYSDSVPVMVLLSWWGAFACLNSFASNTLFAMDRARYVTQQAAVSLGTNLILNIVLIGAVGAIAAAISILCAEAVGTVYLFVRLRGTGARPRCSVAFASKLLLAVAVSALVGTVISRWVAALGLVSALALYVVMLLLTRGIDRGDSRLLRLALSRH